jgi:copper chaperone CopZ
MKMIALSIASAFALSVSVSAADVSAKITEVHLCCKSCVTGVEKAVGAVDGAKAEADQDSKTVTLTGPDAATVQKAADAMVKAGYFGKSSDAAVKIEVKTGASGKQVQTLTVEGVHLCCPKCVKAVDKAVKSVAGAKEQNATKGAKTFEVTGDFKDSEVFEALQKEGFGGKVGK